MERYEQYVQDKISKETLRDTKLKFAVVSKQKATYKKERRIVYSVRFCLPSINVSYLTKLRTTLIK